MNRAKLTRRASLGLISSGVALAPAINAMGANERVRLGVIGTGGRGQQLLKILTHISGFQVVAVCDIKPGRLQKAAEICEDAYPNVKSYADFRKMLDREQLDACIVATEVGNHAHCVIPVLERGLHCFSEKPMESNVEKVDAVARAARKAKGIYQAGFQRRYLSGFQDSIARIHAGEAGMVRYLQGQWHWDWAESGWCHDAVISGGEIVEQACHHLDAMQWVMNGKHPVRCAAAALSSFQEEVPSGCPSEDHSSIAFQFENGVVFSYTQVFDTCTAFTGEKLWVYASKGGVDLIEGLFHPKADKEKHIQWGKSSNGWNLGTPQELEAFAKHIRNGETPLSNVETARISTLMAIMARRAMYDLNTRTYTPRVIEWDDLGSATG